jgi:hypothetical protein
MLREPHVEFLVHLLSLKFDFTTYCHSSMRKGIKLSVYGIAILLLVITIYRLLFSYTLIRMSISPHKYVGRYQYSSFVMLNPLKKTEIDLLVKKTSSDVKENPNKYTDKETVEWVRCITDSNWEVVDVYEFNYDKGSPNDNRLFAFVQIHKGTCSNETTVLLQFNPNTMEFIRWVW